MRLLSLELLSQAPLLKSKLRLPCRRFEHASSLVAAQAFHLLFDERFDVGLELFGGTPLLSWVELGILDFLLKDVVRDVEVRGLSVAVVALRPNLGPNSH